ncbi:DNA-binding transcriptional regulator, LysR family [Verrucomicrobium sp. GAS474]|uniref:LysR family transcriptional regulator n=1 Tax=Verrucomicrobium sp. GAS474 TaxID=1882831 RepID=UPI00087AA499|nr:LysR family transcriptional regulator [Verrucomicrobium sp. GAS474]SDT89557.1 DNA-binding transcriptional regulator, LysR family [Verrucomicrobium sp. GAS474]
MEIRHVRALKEVVEQGGFSKAAKTLGATQSTVSKAVAQLEHDCGSPLLDRSARSGRPRLTAAGEVVYRRGLALLREQEGLRGDLDALNGLRRGHLDLGIPPLGSGTLFAGAIAEYRRRHPGIEIRLKEAGGRWLEEKVVAGELELGVTLPPLLKGCAWREIHREPLMALLPPGFAWPKGKPIRLKDLAGQPFVLFEEGFSLNAVIESACRKRGFSPAEAARSAQPDFIIALVAAGLGVGILPRLVVEVRRLLPIRAIPLADADLGWTPGLIWRRGRPLSPAARAWTGLLRETFPAFRLGKNNRGGPGDQPPSL